jgi:hypothetical protein
VDHPIESVRRLAGKTVILSFWALSSVAGAKLGANLIQLFGAGGGGNVHVPGQSVTLATTWARYSLTFAIPTAIGSTFGTAGTDSTRVRFWLSSGATNATNAGNPGVQSYVLNLWGVQLEIAQPGQTVPTPLEKRDPVLELQQCQRFFQTGKMVWGGNVTSGVTTYLTASRPTTMRGIAQMIITTNGSSGYATPTLVDEGTEFLASAAANFTGAAVLSLTFTASADL